MCEAEDRIRRALFVLENEWGCGRIDVGQMKHILQGRGEQDDCVPGTEESSVDRQKEAQ